MTAYDFDRTADRSGTWCIKWDMAGDAIPMWVADMDFQTAPEIIAEIEKRAAHGIYGYTDLPDEWRQAYASWWKRRHGIAIEPDWLIFASGVVPAISSMVRKLTTPGEKVLIQTPVYNIFYNCILNNGREVLESPLKLCEDPLRYEIDFEDLAAKLADPQCSLMILCNPQNPSGRIWSRQELAKIAELAAANGVTVISDEIHCDLADPGFEYVPFASVSETAKRISATCIAPTKTFNLAGIHSSAVFAADPFLRHRIWRGINTDDVGEPGCFAPGATIAAFEKGEPWLNNLCAYIAESKRILAEFLEKELPQIRLMEGPATYLCWLDARAVSEDDKPLQRFLKEKAGVFVSSGSAYGNAGIGFLRVNVACPKNQLTEALKRLKAGVQAFGK